MALITLSSIQTVQHWICYPTPERQIMFTIEVKQHSDNSVDYSHSAFQVKQQWTVIMLGVLHKWLCPLLFHRSMGDHEGGALMDRYMYINQQTVITHHIIQWQGQSPKHWTYALNWCGLNSANIMSTEKTPTQATSCCERLRQERHVSNLIWKNLFVTIFIWNSRFPQCRH